MRNLLFFIFGTIVLASCTTDGEILGKMNDFDQGPMLQNIGNELILPAYQNLSTSTQELKNSVEILLEAPTLENLEQARTRLKQARLDWQYCSPYQFGPAETYALSAVLNIYPIDVNQIERNLSEETYDLNTLSNSDARGFQTLGYFLHQPDLTDDDLLADLKETKKDYMLAVATQIASTTLSVYTAWSSEGGNYLGTFTSEDAFGVNVGSSVGKLVNAMNLDFERNTRDGKIGIPAGVRSLGEPILTATEAYYADYSVELFNASIDAYHQLYTGGEDVGLDDYLKAIQATTTSNEELAEKISAQFETIKKVSLSDPLSAQITNDIDPVLEVFAEMQRLIVMFKTDMASSIGVVITYQDNDGD